MKNKINWKGIVISGGSVSVGVLSGYYFLIPVVFFAVLFMTETRTFKHTAIRIDAVIQQKLKYSKDRNFSENQDKDTNILAYGTNTDRLYNHKDTSILKSSYSRGA